jgi:5'-methylthioadenosine phosphorylase
MLGIIGGSGLYQIEGIKVLDEKYLFTPYGDPSDAYIIAEIEGQKVVFLSRHGKGHKIPPHLINYRANIWGFRMLGVNKILSVGAVGGINPLLRAGDFVISDQFIDFTKVRPNTFYEGDYTIYEETEEKKDLVSEYMRNSRVVHIDVSEPFCKEMRKVLIDTCDNLNLRYHSKGCYVATEGPRLETAAEIKMFGLLGADIVGMTLVPEIVLARELNMHFASINVVTNLAAGIKGDRLTSDEVIEMMKIKQEELKKIIINFVKNLPKEFNCNCEDVLNGAAI